MRAWILVLGILLAGCTQAPNIAEQDPALSAVNADVDEANGAIRGVIVDASIQPVAFATVMLGDRERVTGENGTFRFSLIPPGNHRVTIDADGFQAMTQDVTVAPGDVADLRVALEVDRSARPYHAIFPFDGFFEVGAGPATDVTWGVATGAGIPPCTCSFEIPMDDRPAAMIVEAFWDNQIYTNNVRHTEYTATLSWDGGSLSTTQSNPMHWYIDGADLPAEPWLTVSMSPDEVVPTFQQEFTIIATPFYIEAPDTNWRFAING